MAKFYMIGTAPELGDVYFGVDLERDEDGWWKWWEPGRPHMIQGSEAEDVGDGWYKIQRTDIPMDLYYKEWGIWVKPATPGLRDKNTDEEALQWVQAYWDAEVKGGGW